MEPEAMPSGEIEMDESYFCGKHKGKRGRGAADTVVCWCDAPSDYGPQKRCIIDSSAGAAPVFLTG